MIPSAAPLEGRDPRSCSQVRTPLVPQGALLVFGDKSLLLGCWFFADTMLPSALPLFHVVSPPFSDCPPLTRSSLRGSRPRRLPIGDDRVFVKFWMASPFGKPSLLLPLLSAYRQSATFSPPTVDASFRSRERFSAFFRQSWSRLLFFIGLRRRPSPASAGPHLFLAEHSSPSERTGPALFPDVPSSFPPIAYILLTLVFFLSASLPFGRGPPTPP